MKFSFLKSGFISKSTKAPVWRKFWKIFFWKIVRVNLWNYHTVTLWLQSRVTVWKFKKFTPTTFYQKFRETNVFTKEVTLESISQIILSVRVNLWFSNNFCSSDFTWIQFMINQKCQKCHFANIRCSEFFTFENLCSFSWLKLTKIRIRTW